MNVTAMATVMGWVTCATAPPLSGTVRVASYVPDWAEVCDGATPLPLEPSPKFHAYDEMGPSGSREPDASPDTGLPETGLAEEKEKDAVGAWLVVSSAKFRVFHWAVLAGSAGVAPVSSPVPQTTVAFPAAGSGVAPA